MSTETTIAPQPIEAPADFPVAWERIGDEHLLWEHDLMHFPAALLPLEEEFVTTIGRGFTHAIDRYEIPLAGARYQILNGYGYLAVEPLFAAPEELARREQVSGANLMAAMGRLAGTWEGEILPEVQSHIATIEAVDVDALSAAELAAHIDDAWARLARAWNLHFEIILPAYLAVSEFDELYRAVFEPDDQFASHRLLQGVPNVTVESGHALWKLAELGSSSAEVRDALAAEDAEATRAALAATEPGRAFLHELDVFLDVYGHRAQTWGLATSSWVEDPSPVLANLRDFVGGAVEADPRLVASRLAAERDQAIAEARALIATYPPDVVAEFEALLQAATEGIAISEDHNFWIDFRLADSIRQLALAAGRRLVAHGALEQEDDVLLLRRDELIGAVRTLGGGDLRDLVASRKAAYEGRHPTPPRYLGSIPPAPPPDNPITRFVVKFFGPGPQVSVEPDVILGVPGATGTARGTARVITTLADAHRLGRGEILVSQTTSPPWTPLFATAAGVVTETGGILSHAAVVAREYAVPTVIGAAGATTLIQDGQTIEIDGDTGVVRIVD